SAGPRAQGRTLRHGNHVHRRRHGRRRHRGEVVTFQKEPIKPKDASQPYFIFSRLRHKNVFPPRDSRVHSVTASFLFGSRPTISASPSQSGPQERKMLPCSPGLTRVASGNHFVSSLGSVSALQTASTGALRRN